jgi:hypothetical protein
MEMYGKFFPSNDATKEKTTFKDIFALTSMGISDNMHEVNTCTVYTRGQVGKCFPIFRTFREEKVYDVNLNCYHSTVEGLYCKRPIQCVASSKILTPPPPHLPHCPASVYPPLLMRGEDTLAVGRGGGGSIVWKTPDTALYSIYVISLCISPSLHLYCPIRQYSICYTDRRKLRERVGWWILWLC